MRLTGSRVYSRPPPVPKMPAGLVELIEGLTKEVLKNNPPEVYEFCAEHMRKLLEIRDGPSNKKPLSLDQKISRAQDKIRKRAEQRRQKFDNDLQLAQGGKPNDEFQTSEKIAPMIDNNMSQSILKPIHNDLTQDSEIEISCEPHNTTADPLHSDAAAHGKQISVTTELTGRDDNRTPAYDKDDKCHDPNDKLIPACDGSNDEIYRQPQQNNACDVESLELDSKHINETLEKVEPGGGGGDRIENSKVDNIGGLTDKVNDDNETVVKIEENIKKSEVVNVSTGLNTDPSLEGKTNENQLYSVISLVENVSNFANKIIETTTTQEKEDKSLSIEETKGNEINNVQTDVADVNVTDNSEVIVDRENLTSEERQEKEVVAESGLTEKDVKAQINAIEVSKEIEEPTSDLEKVMNEAIENTKRKDSSADDSLKDNIIINDESDASESSNLVTNKSTLDEPVKDNDTIDSININHSKADNVVDDKSSESNVPAAPIRSKRAVDDSNIVESNEGRENIETNHLVTNKLDDSSKITLEDNSFNEGNIMKSTKNDNSNTMDLETAAVTIQKVFRNFLFKSRASTFEDSVNEENNLSDDDDKKDDVFLPANNLNKERRALGISRMDTVLQTVNEEKSLSLSTDDSSLSSAATIIQAHVRGFLIRNKLHIGKSTSKNSMGVSGPSSTSLDGDTDQNKSKTVLNIHIVPEGGNYLSRDESMITSMDLSLDGSPPSSVNLHPLGYNTSERRKQLKREDAVQSVSPPSNNSGKLSEDVDSIKEQPTIEHDSNANQEEKTTGVALLKDDSQQDTEVASLETTPTTSLTVETVVEVAKPSNTELMSSPEPNTDSSEKNKKSLTKQSSDEMDVVTPYKENSSTGDTKLIHSGEFHDSALPTKVSRSDTPVVSEFKNVLVYFLLWNNS